MDLNTIRKISIPFLLAIKEQMTETFGLSCLNEKSITNRVLYSLRGPEYCCFNIPEDTETPAYTSAPGKALLAFLPDESRKSIVKRIKFHRFTETTVTDPVEFEKMLNIIRRQKYATDLGEEISSCFCGGVPILDSDENAVAALWFSGVNTRLPRKVLLKNVKILQDVVGKIQKKMALYQADPEQEFPFSPCVQKAIQLLRERIDKSINCASLATECHVSYSTLRALFHKEVGISIGRYHNHLRIEKVEQLLTMTDDSITEIASSLGFYDQKHLSALFKREVGMSPSSYRKQLQNRNVLRHS